MQELVALQSCAGQKVAIFLACSSVGPNGRVVSFLSQGSGLAMSTGILTEANAMTLSEKLSLIKTSHVELDGSKYEVFELSF